MVKVISFHKDILEEDPFDFKFLNGQLKEFNIKEESIISININGDRINVWYTKEDYLPEYLQHDVKNLLRWKTIHPRADGYYNGPERIKFYEKEATEFERKWTNIINNCPKDVQEDIRQLAENEYNLKYPRNILYPFKTPADEGYQEFHKMGWIQQKYDDPKNWMIEEHGWDFLKEGECAIIDILPDMLKKGFKEITSSYAIRINGKTFGLQRRFLNIFDSRITEPVSSDILNEISSKCPYTYLYSALIVIPSVYECFAPFSVLYIKGVNV